MVESNTSKCMRPRHGGTHTKCFKVWKAMIARCTCRTDARYVHYGARGIQVCAAWRAFESFRFDMGDPPAGKTLERIDNDGPYSPENCKWATRFEQMRNTRRTRMVTFNGQTMCVSDWAIRIGIKPHSLQFRLKHWPIDKALTTPAIHHGRR